MNIQLIYECKILIVDDEPELCKMLKNILQKEGYTSIFVAKSCHEALSLFATTYPQLVILDVMLPDGDGFSLIQNFRAQYDVPVIFLSARDEDENRLLGLGLGADDYIAKPFLPRELLLRLKAILTRTYLREAEEKQTKPIFTIGDTQVNLNTGLVTNPRGTFSLTAKEFILVEKLYENFGNIVTGDSLCRAAWGNNLYGYENSLMVHIRRLREKIEPHPSNPQYLLTVRGLGYKLTNGKSI